MSCRIHDHIQPVPRCWDTVSPFVPWCGGQCNLVFIPQSLNILSQIFCLIWIAHCTLTATSMYSITLLKIINFCHNPAFLTYFISRVSPNHTLPFFLLLILLPNIHAFFYSRSASYALKTIPYPPTHMRTPTCSDDTKWSQCKRNYTAFLFS